MLFDRSYLRLHDIGCWEGNPLPSLPFAPSVRGRTCEAKHQELEYEHVRPNMALGVAVRRGINGRRTGLADGGLAISS